MVLPLVEIASKRNTYKNTELFETQAMINLAKQVVLQQEGFVQKLMDVSYLLLEERKNRTEKEKKEKSAKVNQQISEIQDKIQLLDAEKQKMQFK